MAAFLQNFLGGSKPSASPAPVDDADFVDFAAVAPDPSPASTAIPPAADYTGLAITPTGTGAPYTKWYNVHERYSLTDFKQEGVILIVIVILTTIHLMGTRANRMKAKVWITAHAPILEKEFAVVGFGGLNAPPAADVEREELLQSTSNEAPNLPVELLKEKSLNEFSTYATGRQNIAFVDLDLILYKRYNPLSAFTESAVSLFFDSMPATVEKMTATIYPFDGKEALTVPGQTPGAQELRSRDSKSSYDGFVWAVVNKEGMKALRDQRYDLSITITKDNPKLPIWATIMSEAAEITDLLLTPELIKAIEKAGELLDYVIITDQPIDKPAAIDETTPKKRIYLSVRLPTSGSDYTETLPLFDYFLRLPDILVQSAHFRPEVLRKVKATREELIHKLQKAGEDSKAEERSLERDKAKKMKRDLELKSLDAKAQKKYLEKEKEKEQRKMQKRQTTRA